MPFKPRKERTIVNSHLTKSTDDTSIRLNKYIAESGLCSRRKADEYIENGSVKVNGKVVKELGTKVKPSDEVTVNGDPVSYYNKNVYIILNKPKDVITTTADELGRKTVMDIVKRRERVYPVGRLDRNTTGVLLLTNDGELAHRLIHPSYQIEKLYNATLDKKLNFDHAKKIAEGVQLEDGKTAPCFVFIEPTDNTKVTLVLKEGKYREIRRIFEHFGYDVKKLDRKEFAGLSNKGMKRGDYRFLTTKEINELKKKVKLH
jgi:23S rRNA pseudouridine2605 synthase